MSAPDRERLAKKSRRRMYEAHSVIDAAPMSCQAKEYLHLVVTLLGARGWASLYASADKQAAWLAADFNRKGFEARDGQRGKGTGTRRLQLTGQSVLNRLHQARAIGLVRIERRRVPGRRGFTLEVRAAGLLRDALRGVWRSWRAAFDASEGATECAVPAPAALKANVFGVRVQVLPDTSMSRPAADGVLSVVRAARTGAAKAATVIAAALEADTDADRSGADAVARLRALGVLV